MKKSAKIAKKISEMMQKATAQKPKMWGATIVGFGTYQLQIHFGTRRRMDGSRFFAAQSKSDALHNERF